MFKVFKKLSIKNKFILILLAITLISVSIVSYYGFVSTSKAYTEKIKNLDNQILLDVSKNIYSILAKAPEDLKFLTDFYALERYLYWQDVGNDDKKEYWRRVVVDTFSSFISSKSLYQQIRFIGVDGVERIKIIYDNKTDKTFKTTKMELQNKSDHDYVKNSNEMKNGDIFVSKLNLNIENNKIEKPIVPVIRFATPVIGHNKVRYGVIVLNVYAIEFLNEIRKVAMKYQSGEKKYFLISKNGDYLFNLNSDKNWGHILKHFHNFKSEYNNLFKLIEDNQNGFFIEDEGVFSFNKIYPNRDVLDDYWTLISITDKELSFYKLLEFKIIFIVIIILIIFLVLFLSKYFINTLLKPVEAVTKQLERVSRGEIIKESIEYKFSDEIATIIDSTNRLIDNFYNMTMQTDIIASGDYSKNISLLSKNDLLGKSINNMIATLRENEYKNRDSNWLKDGLNSISSNLNGNLKADLLADRSISLIARYTDAGHGLFFIITEEKSLELVASYMFTKRDALYNRVALGEGSIGQVAKEKKPILISDSKQEIETSITHLESITYTVPLLYEDTLLGVIELSFLEFSDLKKEFLDSMAELIASYLFSSLQKEKIENLLTLSNQATKKAKESELQAKEQSEKLQEVNTVLEEQQFKLKEQSEETITLNRQLKEQQSRLIEQSTELKVKNEEILKAKDEVDQRALELERSNKYKSEFLANMSHELRTPLNSIILLSKILGFNKTENLTEEDLKKLTIINRAGEELLRLINDILDLSKVEAGKMELDLTVFESKDLMQEFKELFEDLSKEKKLDFIVRDEFNSTIKSDRNKISQIVRNFLSNSFKFTKEGSIEIILSEINNSIKIVVIDSGIGIPKEKQRVIFEEFRQVDGSISREFGGSGLGLSICKNFANILNAQIDVKSKINEGSEFSILFKNFHVSKKNQEIVKILDDRGNLNRGDKFLLIVDDDYSFAQMLMDLNKNFDFKTLIALNGAEALELLDRYRPNGIILDLVLPDIYGIELFKKIKEDSRLKDVPIHIISSKDIESNENIADSFIQKPINERDIEKILTHIEKFNSKNILLLELTQNLEIDLQNSIETVITTKELNESNLEKLDFSTFDLIICEVDAHSKELALKHLSKVDKTLIFYLDSSIKEFAEFEKISESVILKSKFSKDRLIDDISHFLQDIHIETKVKPTLKNSEFCDDGDLKDKKILLVDDDVKNIFTLTNALETKELNVSTALDGVSALEVLKEERVDLVLTDLMMPKLNGYELIKRIRADESYKDMPIIALTAKTLKDDIKECMEAGANDYLSKPVDYDKLINMLKVWVNKKR